MTATVAIGYSGVNALQLFDDHGEFAKLAAANRHSQEQGLGQVMYFNPQYW